jgi:hypothetical protein
MTEYTYDENTFSDLHKDVYGFRPRGENMFWDATPDEKQRIWNDLLEELDWVCEMEEKREKDAIEHFEKLIKECVELGAKDRNTAIRWLTSNFDAHDTYGYMCYDYGLPYSYETEFENAWSVKDF